MRLIAIAAIAVILFGVGFAASKRTPQSAGDAASEESPEPGGEPATGTAENAADTRGSAAVPAPPAAAETPAAKSAPAAQAPAAPEPYFFSKDDALSAITRTTIRLEKGADIPLLAEPGARLLLTNISDSGDTPIARIELRRGGTPERLELATGGSIAVGSRGAKQVVLEAAAISTEDDSATIRILSFPATRLAPRIPATAWLLQDQTFSYLNESTGGGIRLTVLAVLENKVHVSLSEFEDGTIARTQTQWITDASPFAAKAFTIDVAEISRSLDPAYAAANARWAPHAVAVSILGR